MSTQRWNIDLSHSGIHFTVRHMLISKVRGTFGAWEGALDFDVANPSASKVTARIQAASIDTREANRDQHLRSADFFDVETWPTIDFESRSFEKISGDRYRVVGDLTLHGVTREVVLDTEYLGGGTDPWGNQRIGFQVTTSLNRKDFGLNWNQVMEAGGVLVGEQIEISIDVQAVKAPADEKVA